MVKSDERPLYETKSETQALTGLFTKVRWCGIVLYYCSQGLHFGEGRRRSSVRVKTRYSFISPILKPDNFLDSWFLKQGFALIIC